jgi:hypothetical protein
VPLTTPFQPRKFLSATQEPPAHTLVERRMVEGEGPSLEMHEGPSVRILSAAPSSANKPSVLRGCLKFGSVSSVPFAVGPNSPCWVNGEHMHGCPSCGVEFGTQHKHITRRHCRKCGGVFCYTCTYDKATLRVWPGSLCLPFLSSSSQTNVHVCVSCYDQCPPPADGLRRCRFCHQRVRSMLRACALHRRMPFPPCATPLLSRDPPSRTALTPWLPTSLQVRVAYFDAHHSVCLEEQYSRAQVPVLPAWFTLHRRTPMRRKRPPLAAHPVATAATREQSRVLLMTCARVARMRRHQFASKQLAHFGAPPEHGAQSSFMGTAASPSSAAASSSSSAVASSSSSAAASSSAVASSSVGSSTSATSAAGSSSSLTAAAAMPAIALEEADDSAAGIVATPKMKHPFAVAQEAAKGAEAVTEARATLARHAKSLDCCRPHGLTHALLPVRWLRRSVHSLCSAPFACTMRPTPPSFRVATRWHACVVWSVAIVAQYAASPSAPSSASTAHERRGHLRRPRERRMYVGVLCSSDLAIWPGAYPAYFTGAEASDTTRSATRWS